MQVGLLILFVVMSGVIAVQADKAGRWLGKKRLSIFGLRPRHTARLGTVLVGVVISTITIVSVMLVSSGVREWVIKGPGIANKLEEAILNLQRTTKDVGEADRKNRNLSIQNAKISLELGTRRGELTKAQDKLAELQLKINTLEPTISALTSKVSTGNSKIRDLNEKEKALLEASRIGEEKLKLVQSQEKKVISNSKIISKDNNIIALRNLKLTNLNEKLQSEQTRLKEEQDRLNKEILKIQDDTKQAIATRDRTQQELNGTLKSLEETQTQLSAVKVELAATEQELTDSHQANGKWFEINNVSRHQPMIYRVGEEVARIPVRPRLSASAAQNELTSLIRTARVEARRRGAHGTIDFPEAGIFNHSDKATGETIPTQVIEGQIKREITGAQTEMVMIAHSSLNAFEGEPVSLEITVMPNPVVYSAGQTIVESVIDANRGDSLISDEFSKFLQQTVKDKAQRDGMIPIANSDFSFGQVTLPEILKVIEQLHKADRRVRLKAIASSNTRAADPLKLEFRLQ